MRTPSKLLAPILALLTLVALAGRADADDNFLTGYNLTLKDSVTDIARRYLYLLSKNLQIAPPASVTTDGATLRVVASTFDVTYNLPSSHWTSVNGKIRYRDTHTVNGPIRLVDIYGTKVKLSGKGSQLLHSLATDPGTVSLVFTTGTTRLCFEFGGTVKFYANKLLTRRGAPAPAACAS